MKIVNLFFVLMSCMQFVYGQTEENRKYNTGYNNWYYDSREKLYQGLKSKKVDVVFFGNSITERGPWNELFGDRYKIANRGIGGDNTYGMKARIADVVSAHPKKIFLMMGINDIGRGLPTDSILKNYEEIIQIIQQNSPKTKIYAQSTLPLNEPKIKYDYQIGREQNIRDLNEGIQGLTKKYNITFVNVKEVLADDYMLNPAFTSDGIHINVDAYIEWAKYLKDKKYL